MNFTRIIDQWQRLLLIAIVCHLYRDWGWAGGLVVVNAAFGFAFFQEWLRNRESSRAHV